MPVKKPRRTTKRSVPLSIDVYNTRGKIVKKVTLPREVFGAKVNEKLMAQAVRVFLANQRKGRASTKTRGEVRGSTRKIQRQKHTGRARHGAIRAPIFVGGGIVFGPKPRDFSLKLAKKMRRRALFSSLTQKLRSGEIKVVTSLEKMAPKTKAMASLLNRLEVEAKQKVLLIVPNGSTHIKQAARNIEGVSVTLPSQLTTYEVLRHKTLLFLDKALEKFGETVVEKE